MACFIRKPTQRQDILASPANTMLGRPTHTVIPVLTKKCAYFNFEWRSKRRNTVKLSRNRCTPTNHYLHCTLIKMCIFKARIRKDCKVAEKYSARSYVIQTKNGSRYPRNVCIFTPTTVAFNLATLIFMTMCLPLYL